MTFEELYKTSVHKNALGWLVAIDPTEDTTIIDNELEVKFDKDLKEFMKQNPIHPVTLFNTNHVFSDELEERSVKAISELWKKYSDMKVLKSVPDDEYYDKLQNVVDITKEKLKEKNLSSTDLSFFFDDRLGDSEFINYIVERMANISKEFLKNKRANTVPILKRKSYEEIIDFMKNFENIEYRVTDKNGSFMTAYDKDNIRMHVYKNKDDMFDMDSSFKHELGHALYQKEILNKNTDVGKLGGAISLSLHESSSIIHEISLAGIDYNVRPRAANLYRLGTDKVHYIIHIYIRMKIEKMLFNDEITVREISKTWNDLIEEYIGIRPNNDWEGFLQDVHWNSGAFGYFHSYAIGFFNAINMFMELEKLYTNDEYENSKIILNHINRWYGKYNEYSFDILEDMYPDIEKSLSEYEDFIICRFNYFE